MAITAAALQTALGDGIGDPRVVMQLGGEGDTNQEWVIQGNATYPGRTKMVRTTASDDAATQATAVTDALKAGSA